MYQNYFRKEKSSFRAYRDLPNTTPDKVKTLLVTATASTSSDPWVLFLDDCYTLLAVGLEVSGLQNRNYRSKGRTWQIDLSHRVGRRHCRNMATTAAQDPSGARW